MRARRGWRIQLELILFVLLLGFSAFFSSTETAMFSHNQIQLEKMRQDGNLRLELIDRMLGEPRRLLVTILIGNEFVNVAASVLSASMIIEMFGEDSKLFNLFVMVPMLLIIGEITPKTLEIRNNIAFATIESQPIALFAKLISPLRRIVRHTADFFTTLIVGSERSRPAQCRHRGTRTRPQALACTAAAGPFRAGNETRARAVRQFS